MKRYISHLVFALLGCMALSACVDNDYMELDKGHNELVLSTSNTEVVLNEQAHGVMPWNSPGQRARIMVREIRFPIHWNLPRRAVILPLLMWLWRTSCRNIPGRRTWRN